MSPARIRTSIVDALRTKAHVDRALIYGFLASCSRMVLGPVTAILIVRKFSPEQQGYYFTFASLQAMQVFVELGLSYVIVQLASHESERIAFGPGGHLSGDPGNLARLNGLGRICLLWYFIAGLLVALGIGTIGVLFFSRSPDVGVSWRSPWLALCLVSGARLWWTPIFSLLEGCNQMRAVYGLRFFDSVVSALGIWTAILCGLGLWASVCSTGASLVLTSLYAVGFYPRFLAFFFRALGEPFHWRAEVWPMQWRIAVSWGSSYLGSSLIVPITFRYQGAVVSGRLGLVWTLCQLLPTVGQLWLLNRAPRIGQLVARKAWNELDRLFFSCYRAAVAVGATLGLSLLSVVAFLTFEKMHLAQRFLSVGTTGLFLLGSWVLFVSSPQAIYMRAHKAEPIYVISLVHAASLGLTFWWLGSTGSRFVSTVQDGATPAMAIGYIACNSLAVLAVTRVWLRFRREAHRPDS